MLSIAFLTGCTADIPPTPFNEKPYVATYELKMKSKTKNSKSKTYKIKIASDGKRYKRFDVVDYDPACPIELGMNDYAESKHYGPGVVEGEKKIWWRRFKANDRMLDEDWVKALPSSDSIEDRKVNGYYARGWDANAKGHSAHLAGTEQYWYEDDIGCLVSAKNKNYDIKLTNLKKESLPRTAFEIPANSELIPDTVWELEKSQQQSHDI